MLIAGILNPQLASRLARVRHLTSACPAPRHAIPPRGNTGLHVSVLSYGVSSRGGVFRHTDDTQGIRFVHVALDHGINFIEASPQYGATRAETVLGRALEDVARDR